MKKNLQHLISASALALFVFIAFGSVGDDEDESSNSTTKIENTPIDESLSQAEKDSIMEVRRLLKEESAKQDAVKEQIVAKLKERAKRDWPNDYTTQEYWINEQIDAYEYMLKIPDNSIKRKAQKDWPLDFSTQKYWYNEQIEAKERLN